VALTSTHGRGELERAVLACLAASPGAMTPAQVQAALGHELAYTTVMTTLARLHAKKVLHRTAQGRAYAYALIGDEDAAQSGLTAHRMLQALEAGANRAGVLARFVDDLSAEDEALLVAALENAQRDPGAGARVTGER
jgi:predicted transcriptional regulator